MKKRIGILDEVAYSYELMQKLNREEGEDLSAYSFSEKRSVKKHMDREPLDVLIVGEAYYEEELEEYAIPCKILLTEQQESGYQIGGAIKIYKYQAFHKVLQEIKRYWGEGLHNEKITDGSAYFIGIYSPVRRCGKTSFALALAKKLALSKRVLYMNLEPYCGNLFAQEDAPEWNLADVLYFLKQREGADLFDRAILNYEGVRALFPMDSPIDLQEIEQEEWDKLFELLGRSDAEVVIVDFDESVRCFFYILELCNCIYMPVLEEDSQGKAAAFFRFLEKAADSGLKEKIKQFTLPILNGTNMELLYQIVQKVLGELHEEK